METARLLCEDRAVHDCVSDGILKKIVYAADLPNLFRQDPLPRRPAERLQTSTAQIRWKWRQCLITYMSFIAGCDDSQMKLRIKTATKLCILITGKSSGKRVLLALQTRPTGKTIAPRPQPSLVLETRAAGSSLTLEDSMVGGRRPSNCRHIHAAHPRKPRVMHVMPSYELSCSSISTNRSQDRAALLQGDIPDIRRGFCCESPSAHARRQLWGHRLRSPRG